MKKALSPESLLHLSEDSKPIDYSDIPEIPDDVLVRAQKERRGRFHYERVPLDLDIEVVDWFKRQSPDWRQAMSNVLQGYMQSQSAR